MDFNNFNGGAILFSFNYGGKPFREAAFTVSETKKDSYKITEYSLGGLTVRNIIRKYEKYGVYEWRTELENTSEQDSELIERLFDCDISLYAQPDAQLKGGAWLPEKNEVLKIYAPYGSNWSMDEFHSQTEELRDNYFPYYLRDGQSKRYEPSGGRSSDTRAPFIEVNRGDDGFISAIGWSGQWVCELSRQGENVRLCTGIADAAFVLHSGEKLRTSSMTLMPYHNGRIAAHNAWRRFIREYVSPVGKDERPDFLPYCMGVWGGMTTSEALERLDINVKNQMPFECAWMDAGWYGLDDSPSPDEFEGNWGAFTGDWRVNPYKHPDGLLDYTSAVHRAGMRFLLWFEPERVRREMDIYSEHPEYFIALPSGGDVLLNLGDDDAWNYCFALLSEMIERLKIDTYRQDFNIAPLSHWRSADTENRRGITEIRYINGLYRLWDALLEKFPYLLIDDCASGGRRIDMETLRRSIPLWRSDAQCPANYRINTVQNHSLAINLWMPYSGTSTSRLWGDLYRFRSSYSPALTTNYSYSARDSFGDNQEMIEWVKKYSLEYLRVRPYMYCDFYPLTEPDMSDTTWYAVRFDRPELSDGIIIACRRDDSPYEKLAVQMELKQGSYEFTDADSGEVSVIDSKELSAKGFEIAIHEKHSSKLYFYKLVK